MIGSAGAIVWRLLTALVGVLALGIAISGIVSRRVGWAWRLGLVIAAVALASGHLIIELAALAVVVFGLWWHRASANPMPRPAEGAVGA